MGLKPKADELASRVGERMRASKDKSTLAFHNRIREVIRGAGITNESQRRRYFAEVHRACVRHSANARRIRAAGHKLAGAKQ